MALKYKYGYLLKEPYEISDRSISCGSNYLVNILSEFHLILS